jgi:hypothetical protein
MSCPTVDLNDEYLLYNYKTFLDRLRSYWDEKETDADKQEQIHSLIDKLRDLIENQYLVPDIIEAKRSILGRYMVYYQCFVKEDVVSISKYFRSVSFPLDISGKCENVVISTLLYYSYKFNPDLDSYFDTTSTTVEKGGSYINIETKIKTVWDIGKELKYNYDKMNIEHLVLDLASLKVFSKELIIPTKENILPYDKWFGLPQFLKDFGDKIKIPGVNVR